jgi:hypothetical protein
MPFIIRKKRFAKTKKSDLTFMGRRHAVETSSAPDSRGRRHCLERPLQLLLHHPRGPQPITGEATEAGTSGHGVGEVLFPTPATPPTLDSGSLCSHLDTILKDLDRSPSPAMARGEVLFPTPAADRVEGRDGWRDAGASDLNIRCGGFTRITEHRVAVVRLLCGIHGREPDGLTKRSASSVAVTGWAWTSIGHRVCIRWRTGDDRGGSHGRVP